MLCDNYDAATDGLAAFVLVEAELQPLTEQINFRDVRKTRCGLRVGQVWGEVLDDGSYLLVEYLSRGKEGVDVRRWRTRWNRQTIGASIGDTTVMDPEDFAHAAGTARGYPVEEVFSRVSFRAVCRREGTASSKSIAVWSAMQPWDLTIILVKRRWRRGSYRNWPGSRSVLVQRTICGPRRWENSRVSRHICSGVKTQR